MSQSTFSGETLLSMCVGIAAATKEGGYPDYTFEIIRNMLNKGANPDTTGFEGKQPVDRAIDAGLTPIVNLFKRYGADNQLLAYDDGILESVLGLFRSRLQTLEEDLEGSLPLTRNVATMAWGSPFHNDYKTVQNQYELSLVGFFTTWLDGVCR